MKKLTIDDIDTEFVYDWVGFLESTIMHEYNRVGVEGLREKYVNNIEEFRKDWSHDEFCFLLGMLEYLIPDYRYPEECTRDKYVLNPFEINEYVYCKLTGKVYQPIGEGYLECMVRHGYLWNELGETF